MSETLAIPDMAACITAGHAQPLLTEGTPGPVRHRGQWWAVPADAEHYQPATAEHAARLDAHAARLARAQRAARSEA